MTRLISFMSVLYILHCYITTIIYQLIDCIKTYSNLIITVAQHYTNQMYLHARIN